MKKQGRGSFSEYITTVDGVDVACVRWFDNKLVTLLSTFVGADPVTESQRWFRKEKIRKSVVCPQIVTVYNKHMGGVDTLDSMMGLYRIHVRSKKYYLRIFFHFVDIAVVNAWILYRRVLKQTGSQVTVLPLLDFKSEVAQGLCRVNKSGRKRSGRPVGIVGQVKRQRVRVQPVPQIDLRTDDIGHWPEMTSRRLHCRVITCKGQSRVKCSKCQVHLCFDKSKNCIRDYHTV